MKALTNKVPNRHQGRHMNITEKTREITSSYRQITGAEGFEKRLTMTDFIAIRNQAIFELANGYEESETISHLPVIREVRQHEHKVLQNQAQTSLNESPNMTLQETIEKNEPVDVSEDVLSITDRIKKRQADQDAELQALLSIKEDF